MGEIADALKRARQESAGQPDRRASDRRRIQPTQEEIEPTHEEQGDPPRANAPPGVPREEPPQAVVESRSEVPTILGQEDRVLKALTALGSPRFVDALAEDEVPLDEDEDEEPELAPPGGWLRPPAPRRVEPAPALRWVLIATLGIAAAAITLPLLRNQLAPSLRAREALPEAPLRELAPAVPSVQPAPTPEPAFAPAPTPEPLTASDLGPFEVQINANPWASVEIDGVDVGVTPLSGTLLLGGLHEFRATMPDGRVLERTIEISAENRWITFD